VFSKVPLNISFRRSLLGDNLVHKHNLVSTIAHVRFNERDDVFRWGFTQNDLFTVMSLYLAVSTGLVEQIPLEV
jgi:hypothetical protein